MARAPVVILGVDTSLRSTGWGVLRLRSPALEAVASGVIRIPASRPHTACLLALRKGLHELIERYHPRAMAVEGIFYHKNPRTAMILGQARGVVLVEGAEAGIPVYEYAPRRVKQAVVGTGTAQKHQVGRMVMSILGLAEQPPEDACDALAIAITHAHFLSGSRVLDPHEI